MHMVKKIKGHKNKAIEKSFAVSSPQCSPETGIPEILCANKSIYIVGAYMFSHHENGSTLYTWQHTLYFSRFPLFQYILEVIP